MGNGQKSVLIHKRKIFIGGNPKKQTNYEIQTIRVELNIRRVQIKAERISANYYLTDVQTWPTLCTRLRSVRLSDNN